MRALRFGLAPALIVGLILLGPAALTARAERITTQALLEAQIDRDDARARLHALLARSEIREGLERYGISASESAARVDALTDAEARRLMARLDSLPAGGDGFGTFVVIALIVLVVLLFTDLMGLTDIFPWVNPAKR